MNLAQRRDKNGELSSIKLSINNIAGNKKLPPSKYFHNSGIILKRARGVNEKAFYEYISSKSNHPLNKWLVKYMGTVKYLNKYWLVLENVYYGMHAPCYLDIKIGRKTTKVVPEFIGSEEIVNINIKEDRLQADLISTSNSLGFRIDGYLIIGGITKHFVKGIVKKDYNQLLYFDQMTTRKYIREFLSSHFMGKINIQALTYYLEAIQQIIVYFESLNATYFRGSSLLFLLSNIQQLYSLKFIDFERVGDVTHTGNHIDIEVIFGLRSLLQLFTQILDEENNSSNTQLF